MLLQEHVDRNSRVPFLMLNERNKMVLFPVLFLQEDATETATLTNWIGGPCTSTELDYPTNTWVHVGCEVISFGVFYVLHIKLNFYCPILYIMILFQAINCCDFARTFC